MSKGRGKSSPRKPIKKVMIPKRTLERPLAPFWKRLLKASPVIIVFSVLTVVLEYGGWFRSFETSVLDTWLRFKLNWASQNFSQSSEIMIVAITDEDYNDKDLFAGTSPLKQERVEQLTRAIIAGNPKVIGVDVDTSSWGKEDNKEHRPFHLPETPPIVWARDIERDEDVYMLTALPAREPGALLNWGVARIPRDSDYMIRRYRRIYDYYEGRAPSFPLAVARAAGNAPVNPNELAAIKETEWSLDFAGPSSRFARASSSEILKAYDTLKATDGKDRVSQEKLNDLSNKIVLLGGFYEAGRDIHDTPLGPWAGVELMAQAIETEIKGGHPLPNEIWVMLLGITGSIGLVLLHHRLGWKWALPVSLLAIVVLAPLFSYFTTSTTKHWVYFIPILVAVLMRELYEHFKEHRNIRIGQLADHSK